MIRIIAAILLLFITVKLSAQEVTYNNVKAEYEAFEYEKVIQLSNVLIKQGGVSDSLKIDVYQMRVVAFYSLGDELSTQNSFREILKINKNYSPDPSKISPRLITIFQTVKEDYLKSLAQETIKRDSTGQTEKIFVPSQFKSSALKNIFVPGWGQISNGNSTKGYLLTTASSINLAAMIYFIFDTKKKENEYLKEINKNLMQPKFDSFNKSYKIRNTLIASYIIIWLYSQLDLHLLGNGAENISDSGANEITYSPTNQEFLLSWRIPFSL
jgi:hypothetical protein